LPFKNKEDHRVWIQARRDKIREIVIEAKNKACLDCDRFYPSYVMTFDHVKGEKKFNIGEATARAKSIKALLEEIDKCEVVCHNCHAVRTHGRSIPLAREPVLKTDEP
jgi:hypothetical protein